MRWAANGVWVGLFEVLAQAAGPPTQGLIDSSVGRSRGGRTTKIHALTDRACLPLAVLLTGGQVADCKAGALLLERPPTYPIVLADKAHDSDAIRRQRGDGSRAQLPAKGRLPVEATLLARALSRP